MHFPPIGVSLALLFLVAAAPGFCADAPAGAKAAVVAQEIPTEAALKAAVLTSMHYYFNVEDAFAFDLPKETDERGTQMHDDGNPTRLNGKQLVDGRPSTLVVRVALRGDDVTISSQLDSKPSVQWSGAVSDLDQGTTTPWPGAIGIHADKECPLEILGAKLEVVSGSAMLLH